MMLTLLRSVLFLFRQRNPTRAARGVRVNYSPKKGIPDRYWTEGVKMRTAGSVVNVTLDASVEEMRSFSNKDLSVWYNLLRDKIHHLVEFQVVEHEKTKNSMIAVMEPQPPLLGLLAMKTASEALQTSIFLIGCVERYVKAFKDSSDWTGEKNSWYRWVCHSIFVSMDSASFHFARMTDEGCNDDNHIRNHAAFLVQQDEGNEIALMVLEEYANAEKPKQNYYAAMTAPPGAAATVHANPNLKADEDSDDDDFDSPMKKRRLHLTDHHQQAGLKTTGLDDEEDRGDTEETHGAGINKQPPPAHKSPSVVVKHSVSDDGIHPKPKKVKTETASVDVEEECRSTLGEIKSTTSTSSEDDKTVDMTDDDNYDNSPPPPPPPSVKIEYTNVKEEQDDDASYDW